MMAQRSYSTCLITKVLSRRLGAELWERAARADEVDGSEGVLEVVRRGSAERARG